MAQAPSPSVPVVLVHGFLASPSVMWSLRRRLTRVGLDVHSPRLSPLVLQDVRALAQQLDRSVERVRRHTRSPVVDVVGASQGGILGLWWALHLGGWSRVRRLVLIGAPVRGTWAALAALPTAGLVGRGAWQMLPGSGLLQELELRLPADAEVVTLSMRGDPICPPARCHLPGADNRVLPHAMGPLAHQYMMFSPAVGRELVTALLKT